MARREARLYSDDELGVLWLTHGRCELALSDAGVWLRVGRRTADLPWVDIDQVQLSTVRGGRASVEIFGTAGSRRSVGPFPAAKAEQWVRAAAVAARSAQRTPLPLEGTVGFALPPR